tara:strand:+ start:2850 stop:4010 length:1161 start_codon:yes stop_codon:yes gene_type:complete
MASPEVLAPPAPPPPPCSWPPSSVSYTVTGRLGSGTFGVVYRARRATSNTRSSDVALKVVPRYTLKSSRELETMLTLCESPHASVMQLVESFSTRLRGTGCEARHFTVLVLPLYDSSLRDWLHNFAKSKDTDATRRLSHMQHIGKQLSAALAHVHALHICHRDVKPENIMVSHAGGRGCSCVLADFGSAKQLGAEATDDPPDEEPLGSIPYVCTRAYRAPELFFGSHGYRFAPDIWSLGCVLAEVVLCGDSLFDADASAPHELLEARESESDASSTAQLHVLVSSLGTPTDSELFDMNPALASPHLSHLLSSWLLVRKPASPDLDWRRVIRGALEGCGGSKRSIAAVTALLGGIFLYSPQRRLSADKLAHHAFWSADVGASRPLGI